MLSITHNTRKRPSTGPRTTHGPQGADWASKWAGPAGLGRQAWVHFGPVRGLPRPVLLPESSISSLLLHVGPYRQFLSELDEAPCRARFGTFLARCSEFVKDQMATREGGE
jgi:hypothetical protein